MKGRTAFGRPPTPHPGVIRDGIFRNEKGCRVRLHPAHDIGVGQNHHTVVRHALGHPMLTRHHAEKPSLFRVANHQRSPGRRVPEAVEQTAGQPHAFACGTGAFGDYPPKRESDPPVRQVGPVFARRTGVACHGHSPFIAVTIRKREFIDLKPKHGPGFRTLVDSAAVLELDGLALGMAYSWDNPRVYHAPSEIVFVMPEKNGTVLGGFPSHDHRSTGTEVAGVNECNWKEKKIQRRFSHGILNLWRIPRRSTGGTILRNSFPRAAPFRRGGRPGPRDGLCRRRPK